MLDGCETFSDSRTITVKPETLASGNVDKFGELGSNHQTLTFQSKATKQNKHLPTYKSTTMQNKIRKHLCQHFAKVSFTKIP